MTAKIYGFGSRLTALFPSQVVIDITEVCNLACVHCPHTAFTKTDHYGARYLPVELNNKIVDEVCRHGLTQYIRYSSEGEPLMHPFWQEMIRYAVQHSGTFVTLTTNGTLLTEQRINALVDSGVQMIDVSIDAHSRSVYEKIRQRGNFDGVVRNVRKLIEVVNVRGSAAKIVVSFIEQPMNSHEVTDFVSYWRDAGISDVVVRKMHSAAGAVSERACELRENQRSLKRRPCVYPWERIVLTPSGALSFCPADWTRQASLVDYRITTVAEVWQGEFYQALRVAHETNDFSRHTFCGQCPDWVWTHWPREGRGYADMVEDIKRQG